TRFDVTSSLAIAQQSLSSLSSTMGGHCASIDKAVEKRTCKVEHRVDLHDTRVTKLEAELQELRGLLGPTRCEEVPRPPVGAGGFVDRDIDPTMLVVRVQGQVPREHVAKAAGPPLADFNMAPADYSVEGEPADKLFRVVVKGQKAYSLRRACQAAGVLRLRGRGAGWRRIATPSPMGGADVELSTSADKGPQMVAKELGSGWNELVSFDPAPGSQPPKIHFSVKSVDAPG
ncbi:unnamed protein product, partial [Prorocentrum cordatum]